ncbi:hypothetical protein C2U48_31355 (plasmid) [Escherichia coli]|nr:hypothetical protein C2U48_31355 [Escherichia coli]
MYVSAESRSCYRETRLKSDLFNKARMWLKSTCINGKSDFFRMTSLHRAFSNIGLDGYHKNGEEIDDELLPYKEKITCLTFFNPIYTRYSHVTFIG